jgi:hypothetical protein
MVTLKVNKTSFQNRIQGSLWIRRSLALMSLLPMILQIVNMYIVATPLHTKTVPFASANWILLILPVFSVTWRALVLCEVHWITSIEIVMKMQ